MTLHFLQSIINAAVDMSTTSGTVLNMHQPARSDRVSPSAGPTYRHPHPSPSSVPVSVLNNAVFRALTIIFPEFS